MPRGDFSKKYSEYKKNGGVLTKTLYAQYLRKLKDEASHEVKQDELIKEAGLDQDERPL